MTQVLRAGGTKLWRKSLVVKFMFMYAVIVIRPIVILVYDS